MRREEFTTTSLTALGQESIPDLRQANLFTEQLNFF